MPGCGSAWARCDEGEHSWDGVVPWLLDMRQHETALQDVVEQLGERAMADAHGVADAGGAPPRRGVVPASIAVVGVHDARTILEVLDAGAVEARVDPEEEEPSVGTQHSSHFGEDRR